jgi:RNA polymerase sigma-70 factor (ECF subfamily)
MNDQQAVTALKRGDLRGLEALVLRYQVEAVRTAYAIVRDAALAEDISQSAFIKLTQHIAQFDEDRRFAPWFMRIVARDAVAAIRREPHTLSLDVSSGEAPDWIEQIEASDPSIDAMLEQAQTSAELWALLETLSPEQRAVVVLRYYSDLKHAEIAHQLGVPEGTIRSRLHTALRQLHRMLLWREWASRQDAPFSDR